MSIVVNTGQFQNSILGEKYSKIPLCYINATFCEKIENSKIKNNAKKLKKTTIKHGRNVT